MSDIITLRHQYRSRNSSDGWREAVKKYERKYNGKVSMVYRFFDTNVVGKKYIVYVGRSDSSENRMNSHINAINTFINSHHEKIGKVTGVNFCFITGRRRQIVSYYEECLQYHLFGGKKSLRGNSKHPEQPHSRNKLYKCPICDGINSKSYAHFEINGESRHRDW